MTPGECVFVDGIGGKTGRPGVYLRQLADGRHFVLVGSSRHEERIPSLMIDPREPAGKALRVLETTYFSVHCGKPAPFRLLRSVRSSPLPS